ncbi:nuclear transport factor 2 family protein [Phenylobacterium sp. J426]|uniref:nuclear transport factor 2 family protein n=1 Tax=Phenylobacterium sp. J426 TaxID=2898439 RepID=UPI002150D529|nr:nuclear transport factor 2 family protein [Phenylobacterium sp. J426]MCR5875292.1 nuclear transport factor 2 family protein [Phenylobacterium sp. J426]
MDQKAAIGAVIDEMYAMISGPAGPRDWSRQPEIFHPDARQMRTGVDDDGTPWIRIMSPDAYRVDVAPFFAANPFFEVEIARRIDVLGNMAHVWSLYEARTAPDDATPERRGINSIQLYRQPDGGWRIMSMIWDNERPGVSAEPF